MKTKLELELGEWKTATRGDKLLNRGAPIEHIAVPIAGTVSATYDKEQIVQLGPADLIEAQACSLEVVEREVHAFPQCISCNGGVQAGMSTPRSPVGTTATRAFFSSEGAAKTRLPGFARQVQGVFQEPICPDQTIYSSFGGFPDPGGKSMLICGLRP